MFILGQKVTTPLGQLHPVFVRDYEQFTKHINALVFDKVQLLSILTKVTEDEPKLVVYLEMARNSNVYDFLTEFAVEEYEDTFLHEMYLRQKELFSFIFKEDVFDKIKTSEEFEAYRNLITEMNDVKYEPPNPNPELARLDRLKQKLQEMKGENITFEAMYTSILLSGNVAPNDLTLYQFNKAFDRVSHFKNYDTSTLFKTIDTSGKVEITPWYGTAKDEKEGTITQEQLDGAKKRQEEGGLASEL